jgi:hypothetical protein
VLRRKSRQHATELSRAFTQKCNPYCRRFDRCNKVSQNLLKRKVSSIDFCIDAFEGVPEKARAVLDVYLPIDQGLIESFSQTMKNE